MFHKLCNMGKTHMKIKMQTIDASNQRKPTRLRPPARGSTRPMIWGERRAVQNTTLGSSCNSHSSGSDVHSCWQRMTLLWRPERQQIWKVRAKQPARVRRLGHELQLVPLPAQLLAYDGRKWERSENDWWCRGSRASIRIQVRRLFWPLRHPWCHRQRMRIRRAASWQSVTINH